jgi:hypothetical protein
LVKLFECFIKIQKLKQCKKNETIKVKIKSFFENDDADEFFLKN